MIKNETQDSLNLKVDTAQGMSPRREDSKTWTSFPKELLEILRDQWAQSPLSKSIEAFSAVPPLWVVEGRIFPQEIWMRVGFLIPQTISQYNLEVSLDLNPESPAQGGDLIAKASGHLEMLGLQLHHHLQSQKAGDPSSEGLPPHHLSLTLRTCIDQMNYPYSWQEMNPNQDSFYLKYTTTNTELEKQADILLGIDS